MANGDEFSPNELKEYVKPLEMIKKGIEEIANKEGIETRYYFKGWPNIALLWNNRFGLDCFVQLYMDTDRSTYILWAVASKDAGQHRYARKQELLRGIKPPFTESFILEEIKKGIALCNLCKFEDLNLI